MQDIDIAASSQCAVDAVPKSHRRIRITIRLWSEYVAKSMMVITKQDINTFWTESSLCAASSIVIMAESKAAPATFAHGEWLVHGLHVAVDAEMLAAYCRQASLHFSGADTRHFV